MVRNLTALGPDVVEVPLWWRTISLQELTIMIRTRQMQAVPMSVRPGVAQDFHKHMESEAALTASDRASALKVNQQRLMVLEGFNAKLNQVLSTVNPGLDGLVPTPFRLNEGGDGLTFWVESADIGVGDLLEMRFFLFPGLPVPIQGICQVRRLRREWSGSGLRVECSFASFDILEQPVTPVEALVEQPAPPPPPASLKPRLVQDERRQEPSIWEEPVVLDKPSAAPPAPKPRAASPDLPSSVVESSNPLSAKAWDTLNAGMKILETDLKTVARSLPDQTRPNRRPPGPRRQDFRLNDLMPLAWKVITQETYDREVEHFNLHREFVPRERVVRQKRLWMDVDMQLKLVRQFNAKARRAAVWFRERLDLLFQQANSENEEEYYQTMTRMFLAIVRELGARPQGGAVAGQILAHCKTQADVQASRDRMDPEMQSLAQAKANEDLAEIARQIKKMLVELQGSDPGLAEKLLGFHEGWAMIDLRYQDTPKGMTSDGQAIFVANLSATGLAWRTLKSWVAKGDLMEMTMRLSRDGHQFESVLSYGRVVAIQPPDEANGNRVACFFEYMTPHHRETLLAHIARKQREELVRRSGM